MRLASLTTAALALAGSAAMLVAPSAARAAPDAAHPVVIELFQAQGCASCVPADALLARIADRPEVLALSFAVTYWDQLGWKDTFAQPAYTARQWDYAHALRQDNVFTPEVVVNGRKGGSGGDGPGLARLIGSCDRGASGPAITIGAGVASVAAASAPTKGADVWLVRYDPRVIQVAIRRGENGGKTLPHKDIVRELVRLGAWDGRPAKFTLPAASDPALKTAILVQAGKGGPILAAAKAS